jgi:hypothetical protein
VFEGLKRQDRGADVAGLAVPDELHLAFVGEEQERYSQRFAGLEADEVAFSASEGRIVQCV